MCLSGIKFSHLVLTTHCDLKHRSESDWASTGLPSAILLATVAESKDCPGNYVLMIGSMRPENTGTLYLGQEYRLICFTSLYSVCMFSSQSAI